MNKENNSKFLYISYISGYQSDTKTISGTKITDVISKSKVELASVSVDIIKENMTKAIIGVLDIFESNDFDNRLFNIDEIEVTFSIGIEGSVSLLSSVSGGANTQSGIVVKFKRKDVINDV